MKRNIFLALIAILLTLLVADFGISVVALRPKVIEKPKDNWAIIPERTWIQYDSQLGWYNQKSKTASLVKNDFEIEINTNSEGFRSEKEYQRNASRSTKRLVVLGDSFVFGFGVKDNETFSRILEAKLKNIDAINLGVTGYGVDQMLLAYRAIGKKYYPDFVAIGIFPDDFSRALRSFVDSGHAKPYFSLDQSGHIILHNVPTPPPFSLDQNQFPEVVERGPFRKLLQRSMIYRLWVRFSKNMGWSDPNTTDEWILGESILRQLLFEIRNDGAHPFFILIPPEHWVMQTRKDSLYRSLNRFVLRENVDCIDLLPAFQKEGVPKKISDYYISNDGHWTSRGHEFVADLIAVYLKERNLISAKTTAK